MNIRTSVFWAAFRHLASWPEVNEAFLKDTRTAYTKMLGAQEVCSAWSQIYWQVSRWFPHNRNVQRKWRNRDCQRKRFCKLTICWHSVSSRRNRLMVLSMWAVQFLTASKWMTLSDLVRRMISVRLQVQVGYTNSDFKQDIPVYRCVHCLPVHGDIPLHAYQGSPIT